MQLVKVVYKMYPNGERVDETDIFITNGYRPQAEADTAGSSSKGGRPTTSPTP